MLISPSAGEPTPPLPNGGAERRPSWAITSYAKSIGVPFRQLYHRLRPALPQAAVISQHCTPYCCLFLLQVLIHLLPTAARKRLACNSLEPMSPSPNRNVIQAWECLACDPHESMSPPPQWEFCHAAMPQLVSVNSLWQECSSLPVASSTLLRRQISMQLPCANADHAILKLSIQVLGLHLQHLHS